MGARQGLEGFRADGDGAAYLFNIAAAQKFYATTERGGTAVWTLPRRERPRIFFIAETTVRYLLRAITYSAKSNNA